MGISGLVSLFGGNAMGRTTQYDAIRDAQAQYDTAQESVEANLARMRETYSKELAGENYVGELASRDNAIDAAGTSRDAATKSYLQALARAGMGTGQGGTDVAKGGLGGIQGNYQTGVSDMNTQLALAAAERKSQTEKEIGNYQNQAYAGLAEAKGQIAQGVDQLNSTELSGSTNIMENLGNIAGNDPMASLAVLLGAGGMAGFSPGGLDLSQMGSQLGMQGLSDKLGIDLGALMQAGKPDVETKSYNPALGEQKVTYERDSFGNRTGNTTSEITRQPQFKPTKDSTNYLKTAESLAGKDQWANMSATEKSKLSAILKNNGGVMPAGLNIVRTDNKWFPGGENYEVQWNNKKDNSSNKGKQTLYDPAKL